MIKMMDKTVSILCFTMGARTSALLGALIGFPFGSIELLQTGLPDAAAEQTSLLSCIKLTTQASLVPPMSDIPEKYSRLLPHPSSGYVERGRAEGGELCRGMNESAPVDARGEK